MRLCQERSSSFSPAYISGSCHHLCPEKPGYSFIPFSSLVWVHSTQHEVLPCQREKRRTMKGAVRRMNVLVSPALCEQLLCREEQ
jgi:hypothetical protein